MLEDHLYLRQRGELERDLDRNYSPHVVLLSAEGVNHGHDGVRALAQILDSYSRPGEYRYDQILVHDDVGLLAWSTEGEDGAVYHGADTFLVVDGQITTQTIHYAVQHR